MIIYLAGGINGNCKPMWIELIKAFSGGSSGIDIYLAGTQGRRWIVDMYLAGTMYGNQGNMINECGGELLGVSENKIDIAILESFFYADEWTEKIIPKLDRFLLDSGAFTFFTSGKKVNWDEYLERYIDFINRNDVKLFFELDIDKLVGYDKVLQMRKKLEAGTGKQCIPVWHKSRGKDEFLKMCDEYDYVSIGGIVSKEIVPKDYPYFPWFINQAHKRGAKIHGLGFTNLKGLYKYHFDSVDSTSWTTGNRFGYIYTFTGKTIVKKDTPKGSRIGKPREAAIRNFNEWVKFQRYAQYNL